MPFSAFWIQGRHSPIMAVTNVLKFSGYLSNGDSSNQKVKGALGIKIKVVMGKGQEEAKLKVNIRNFFTFRFPLTDLYNNKNL